MIKLIRLILLLIKKILHALIQDLNQINAFNLNIYIFYL
jgi:hypothetical protein